MAAAELQTSSENQPLIVLGGQEKVYKPENKLKRTILWIGAIFMLTLLILSCLPTAPQMISQKPQQKLVIPSFSGPQGSIYETVFYSHYISRILGSKTQKVTTETAIRSIEAIEAWMSEWTEIHKESLASADLQTVQGISRIYSAYVSARRTANGSLFWPRLLQTFRLRAQDVKDEISADEDADRFSLAGHGKMQNIVQLLDQAIDAPRSVPAITDSELQAFSEAVSSSAFTKSGGAERLDQILAQISKRKDQIDHNQVSQLPLHTQAGIWSALSNLAGVGQPETHAHRFLNSFEVLRLSLPSHPQDQLLARVVELLAVSWNNYMYLKSKSVGYLLAEVQKPLVASESLASWIDVAHDAWGQQ